MIRSQISLEEKASRVTTSTPTLGTDGVRPSLVIPKYHYSLEQRVKAAGGGGAPVTRTGPAFVEVVPAAVGPIGASECVIDYADARGATMRITLKSPADLAALSQGFRRSRA